MGKRSVCFVVSDLLGLLTNSGIGTATSYYALVLASEGYDVTLLHTRHATPLDQAWAERYRAAGVALEVAAPMIVAPGHLAPSYRVYEHLKGRRFDTIVFQDWLALGWASIQAKHVGLAFERTQLVHICHGPDAWLHEANLQVALDVEDKALAHAGQRSAELADTILGPSRYLIDWMAAAGWALPDRRFVVPYFTEGHAAAATTGHPPPDGPSRGRPAPLREIAFFGRLERRKGVQVFTRALNAIGPSLLRGVTLSFLGREATYTTQEVLGMLDADVRRAAAGVDFHLTYDNDAARRHLQRPGTLAVIASLTDNSPNTIYECIENGVSFLATAAGGTPELIRSDDRDRCLVMPEPGSMTAGLRAVLEAGVTPAPVRPAFDMAESLRLWDEVLSWEPSPAVTVRERPFVTAVLSHHDRPALVTTAAEALDAQDYDAMEIVVVDDGSRRPESHEVLRAIAGRSWRHPLRVLYQENRYLGAARNAGAAAAKGDLVAFADDDDVPEPRFVSTLVRAAQATGADAVTCAMRSFTNPTGAPRESDSRGTWVFAGGPLYLAAVQNVIGGAPALVRRSVLDAVGGYHERHGVGFEDWHLYVRLLFAGYTIATVPEPLYWYRLQSTSMRSTMSDYHSAQVILEEFRNALPPVLRPLPDLAHGQGLAWRQRLDDLSEELELRESLLWVAEERYERSLRAAGRDGGDGHAGRGGEPNGHLPTVDVREVVRRGLVAGRNGIRRMAAAWPPPRGGQR